MLHMVEVYTEYRGLVAGPEAHTHTLGKQASAIPRYLCTSVYMALATPYLGIWLDSIPRVSGIRYG